MFRATNAQRDLFSAGELLSPEKQAACEKSWAGVFRRKALPILLGAEPKFAEMFDPEHGRPNRSVALVLGVLILKEMKDLTDEEAVAALEFDARWWYAFDGRPDQMSVCEKTLHNFRDWMINHEKGAVVFRWVTDALIAALGIAVDRQRLDSTHILSNFAKLSRLRLMCETIRLFLHALMKLNPGLYGQIAAGLMKRHGEESHYADARRDDGPRRLGVVARDVYRLVEQFKEHGTVGEMDEFKLLLRLMAEQCEVKEKAQAPKDDDDDVAEGSVPVELKAAKAVGSSSMQTPHDRDVTYSGHKGKGYEVQIAETCAPNNPVEMITHVEVTPSCVSDAKATVPTVTALTAAGHKPDELAADTGYSGKENAAALAKAGVNLLAPAPAKGKPDPATIYEQPQARCPETPQEAGEWLKAQEAQSDFQERYAIRAGIEATNSELKRGSGLGRLRVRGEQRVALVVYLKATACNLKRALNCWVKPMQAVEGAVVLA